MSRPKPDSAERAAIEKRRKLVEIFWFQHGQRIAEIVESLKKETPPIEVTHASVWRDIQQIKKQLRQAFNEFDPVDYVSRTVRSYSFRAQSLTKAAYEATDNNEKATLYRAANDCDRLATELLQDAGLVDKKIAAMILIPNRGDVGAKSERMLTGEQIRQLAADSQRVIEGSLVSEGEREMLAEQTEGTAE